ncbi:MAG: family 43 glycosylhydrolase [Butyrivibrio sp.]|nr:family 43 glycosylhydrolase [Butyrivibrio sp.]
MEGLKGADMNLEQAIEAQDLENVINILVENPPCIDEKNKDGVPLFMYAAQTGNLPIVKYIVEYSRASMNTVDGENRTILHYAAMSGNVSMNQYLVEKVGMDITAGDVNLVTPYQIAWERGYEELLMYYERKVGASYENMYHNPIRTGMFPDPSIVRVGGDYYMVNSSFIFFPCIPISHSRDLVHWEIIGHAITNPEWAALDELEGGRGYWAPDISYDNGTFYITATYRLNDVPPVYRKQIVVSSDKPEGPYSKPAIIDEDGIDPSIFHEDGRHYMLLNRGARIFELSGDCKRQISAASLLYYGSQKRAPEGPHLLKKDGYYYLFLAEGGTGPGHRITVARSRELMGNYEPCPYNPIMRQMDEKAGIQRCGHGKPVCTQNGDWYMVYLCGRRIGDGYSILGRETALDPITWTQDGWPIVNNLKGPSVLQIMPRVSEEMKTQMSHEIGVSTQQSADIVTDTVSVFQNGLPKDFITPRPPEKDGISLRNGSLILKASSSPLSDVSARNILVRRQSAFCFMAEADLRMPKLLEGQEAGITCYYDENTWVCFFISKDAGDYFLQVKEHIGKEDIEHEKKKLVDWMDKPMENTSQKEKLLGITSPEGILLTLGVNTRYLNRSFYYRLAGKETKTVKELTNVYYLCDEGISMGKRFTGAMVGMYGYSGGADKPLYMEFVDFRYEEL